MARIFEEKFGSFTAAGFGPTPTAGQLDSDIWVVRGFGDNATPAYGFSGASGTDFGRGIIAPPTDPTTGGVYAGAITAADRALIVQPTGSEFDANGVIEARVKNTSGATATSFTVDFDWIARNNGDRADAMTFSYSTDGTNFTNVPAAAFTSPATLAAGAGFVSKDIAPITLSGLSVAANADLFLRWTHTTSTGSGSRDEVGIDNVTVDTGAAPSGPSFSIAPLSASKAEGNSGTTDFTFTVTRTDSTAAASIDWTLTGIGGAGQASATDFTGPAMGSVAFAIGQTSQTVTLKVVGDTTPESSESFTVTLANPPAGATIATGIANGTIVSDDIATTRIHDIQGVGSESPIPTGQAVTIEAIVVGDFQNGDGDQDRNLNGFYLQEQNANWDADAKTSEGVFVFLGQLSGAADVNVGDKVQVTGTVSEYFGQTQLTATQLSVVQANAVADVSSMAAIIDLPSVATTLSQSGVPQPDLEAYENMLVRFSDQLTITEQFNLDRFNEIKLVAGERPYQFTQTDAPSAVGYQAHLAELGARTITYDDGQSIQNAPIGGLDGFANYNTANAPRMGDTITGLTGVLDYQWSGNSASQATWRVRSVEDGDNSFSDGANTRQAAPSDVGGSLKVASLNVLNYFKTLDTSSSARTAIGMEPRGANNADEFQRQTDKLVNVILKMNVDVLGLVELENDFQPGSSGNAIEYLVNQLNAKVGAGTYDWVRPGTQFVGGDAIGVGAIYKTGSVAIAAGTSIQTLNDQDAAAAALLGQSSKGHIFDGADTSRNALAVTFQDKASGEDFTIAVNHFKSKGGAGTGADADAGNGAGFWNNQRELAAKALDAWLDSKPTGTDSDRTLIMGDLNAYAKENPIAILEAGGYENFGLKLAANYSYTFDGQLGTLDYVLGSEGIADEVTGVTAWHINSDEADALDYNTDFSRDPAIFDATTAVRVSDHDPMIIGLNLQGGVTPPPAYTLQLLHLSDLEGGTLAAKTAPILGALVDRFDDQYANTLVLSGGDNLHPRPVSHCRRRPLAQRAGRHHGAGPARHRHHERARDRCLGDRQP
jgi:predicted extracellular nuclease